VAIGASAGAACERALARVIVSFCVHDSSPIKVRPQTQRTEATKSARVRGVGCARQIRCTPPWKISNIRSSRIVFSSQSVYLIAMVTLRQLRYLTALAKHGHFGRAAEACAVTQ